MAPDSSGEVVYVHQLPPELLQLLGEALSPAELRCARLVCKAWATALSSSMPALTLALPEGGAPPPGVFRQPLMLASNGVLNSARSVDYTAVPRRATCPGRHTSCFAPGLLDIPSPASMSRAGSCEAPSARPSPFATTGGQVLAASSQGSLADACIAPQLPGPGFQAVASLPHRLLHDLAPQPPPAGAAGDGGSSGAARRCATSELASWSSLPAAGLRTCSSLQQLHLKLSGAPPCPEDLAELSALPHLSHLSLRQVEGCSSSCCEPVSEDGELSTALAADAEQPQPGTGQRARSSCSKAAAAGADAGLAAALALEAASLAAQLGGSSIASSWGSQSGVPPASSWGSDESTDCGDDTQCQADQCTAPEQQQPQHQQQAATLDAPGWPGCASLPAQPQSVSCSVITPEHVAALAQLRCLSSLELAPKGGAWDAAAQAGLVQLTRLAGLTRLCLTWGDAAASSEPLSDTAGLQQAHGPALALQACLAGLTQLVELELRGAPVVDVALLQRMQRLRSLTGDALKLVDADTPAVLEARASQLAALAGAAAAPGAGEPPPPPAEQQAGAARRSQRWAKLPRLERLQVLHPASDVGALLQGTQMAGLAVAGFVARGPSDFARLLGQHGRLRELHLVFPEDEPWHPIAVVRLPTALPLLRSLAIEGKFFLPNSLIVGLGVMEVPLESLSLTCKLAPALLDRLQHLRRLRRLALHHMPWAGHVAEGLVGKELMLQLPARLLPPQLEKLEMSNGWIVQ